MCDHDWQHSDDHVEHYKGHTITGSIFHCWKCDQWTYKVKIEEIAK